MDFTVELPQQVASVSVLVGGSGWLNAASTPMVFDSGQVFDNAAFNPALLGIAAFGDSSGQPEFYTPSLPWDFANGGELVAIAALGDTGGATGGASLSEFSTAGSSLVEFGKVEPNARSTPRFGADAPVYSAAAAAMTLRWG